jgi:HEAT repeat protein
MAVRILLPFFVLIGFALAAQEPQSADPKDRARTARELAKQGAEAMPRLRAMLSDPDPEVRVEVVKAIIEIDTERSLDPLVQAAGDNDAEVQIRATDGLVNFYMPGYVRTGMSARIRRVGRAIKAQFTDTNDQVIDPYIRVRAEVIEALGKLARGGLTMDSRANAARAVGILRGKAAVPDLVEALRSKDDQVIFESLIALQKIRDPEAANRISFLLTDPVEKVQIAAIETTGLLQNRDALPQLRSVLAGSEKKKVKRAALTAIAMIPDESSRPLYKQYIVDNDDALRAAAAEGYARLKNPGDRAMLEKAFSSERDMAPRLALAFAVVALGKTETGEVSPLQYLINTLNSSAWRGVARAYLVELAREAGVRKVVQNATTRGTKTEKIELAEILWRSGDQETIPYLEKLSHDADPEVALAALNASKSLKARLR